MAYADLNDYLMQTYGTTDLSSMQSEIQFAGGQTFSVGEIMSSATQTLAGGVIVNVETGQVVQAAPAIATQQMVNTVIPADNSMSSVVSALMQFRQNRYGTRELGLVRRVGGSGIVNESSGIRPGFLPRVVLPPGARKERGWPG